MEIADRLAIINEGRLEQVGSPTEIYDNPANEFVLGFLGPATRLDGEAVRPHDLVLHRRRDVVPGGRAATVERITMLGFEVRVDLRLREAGGDVWVQLSRGHAAELALHPGDEVWVARAPGSPRAPERNGSAPVLSSSPSGSAGGASRVGAGSSLPH